MSGDITEIYRYAAIPNGKVFDHTAVRFENTSAGAAVMNIGNGKAVTVIRTGKR